MKTIESLAKILAEEFDDYDWNSIPQNKIEWNAHERLFNGFRRMESDWFKDDYISVIKKLLKELCNPSEEMVSEGHSAIYPLATESEVKSAYIAMIDKVLDDH